MAEPGLRPGTFPQAHHLVACRVLGGTVHVWREPGRGTRFEIVLPVKAQAAG
jgi:hypothetical protein